MIEAVIFDMDGLLIDSEPFWKSADLVVYKKLGIDLAQHFCGETTGLRVDAAVQHWFDKFPWEHKSLKEVETEIVDHVEALMRGNGVAKDGALELIKELHAAGIPLAVCSSSPLRLIETAMTRLGVKRYFSVLQSAELEEWGKPHPAAYLRTADKLSVSPGNTLVFEDSVLGAIAAKAARMKVIAVPECDPENSSRFDFCDGKIFSLADFDLKTFLASRSV